MPLMDLAEHRRAWRIQNATYNSRTSSATTIWSDWVTVNDGNGYSGTRWVGTSGLIDPWPTWNSLTWTTTTTSGNQVWNEWVVIPERIDRRPMRRPAQRVEAPAFVRSRAQRTEEEWAAIRAEQDRLRAERDRLHAAARAEAEKLLMFVLNAEQRAQYARDRSFVVVGSHGGLYRVRWGTSGNVHQIVNGHEVAGLCAHPELYVVDSSGEYGYLPTEDVLAAQALALMHDESVFQRTANVHWGRAERGHLRAVA